MADTPEGEHAIEYVIGFPVVEDLDFLPYFSAHAAFIRHTEECQRCHVGAFHPEHVADGEDPWCETGGELREKVHVEIAAQHLASTWN